MKVVTILLICAVTLTILCGSWAYTLCFVDTEYGVYPFLLLALAPPVSLLIGVHCCWLELRKAMHNVIEDASNEITRLERENDELRSGGGVTTTELKQFTSEITSILAEQETD